MHRICAFRSALWNSASVLAILLLVPHCGGGGLGALEGHWEGSRVEGPGADEAMNTFAKATSLEVERGRVTVTSPRAGKLSGTYRIAKEEKGKLLIAPTSADASSKTETFALMDAKTIGWEVESGGTKLVFVKKGK
jgi:hypothetical protein